MELTLCAKCAQVYRDMPDHTVRHKDPNQATYEPCSICARMTGLDYIVERSPSKAFAQAFGTTNRRDERGEIR